MLNRSCKTCKNKLAKRFQKTYCSNKCQQDFQYKLYIENWKNKKVVNTKNISKYIKRYFLKKYGEKCSICGWKKRNLTTNKIPLEIDHKDGNHQNNSEKNLRLLCPNCHSLTPNFKNLNKGSGRKWRND